MSAELALPLDRDCTEGFDRSYEFPDDFDIKWPEASGRLLGRVKAATLSVILFVGCPGDDLMASANALLPHTENTTTSPVETNQLVGLFWVDPRKDQQIRLEN
jgi:hypothetical protein